MPLVPLSDSHKVNFGQGLNFTDIYFLRTTSLDELRDFNEYLTMKLQKARIAKNIRYEIFEEDCTSETSDNDSEKSPSYGSVSNSYNILLLKN